MRRNAQKQNVGEIIARRTGKVRMMKRKKMSQVTTKRRRKRELQEREDLQEISKT